MTATIQTIETPKRWRAQDTSGNNNHGQIYSGRALEFDGVGDNLTVAANTEVEGLTKFTASPFTCSLWLYINDADDRATHHVIGTSAAAVPHTLGIYYKSSSGVHSFFTRPKNDKNYFLFTEDGSGGTQDNQEGKNINGLLKTWLRCTIVNTNDSNRTLNLYINGQLFGYVDKDTVRGVDQTTDDVDETTYSQSDDELHLTHIGAPYSGAVYGLDGMMSDFQIWDTAWTADDVAFDYANPEQLALNRGGTSLTESNLKLWYPMNDGHRGQQSYVLDASNVGLGDEMLTNGDFSTGSTGDTTISGWNKKNTDGSDPTTFELSTEQTYNGHHTLKVTGNANADGAKFIASYTAGTTYKLDMWVYVESGAFQANPPDTPFNPGTQNIVNNTTTGQWENIVSILTADEDSNVPAD